MEKRGLVRLPTIAAAQRAAETNTPCAKGLPDDVDQLLSNIIVRIARRIDDELPCIVRVLVHNKVSRHSSTTNFIFHPENQL